MRALLNDSPPTIDVWELTGSWTKLEDLSAEEMNGLLADVDRRIWIDISGTSEGVEAALSNLVSDGAELGGLDVHRAAEGGENPPDRPPKAKAFRRFVFGRLYWLDAKKVSPERIGVVAQELHVIAGKTFAVTMRYPCLLWDQRDMVEGRRKLPRTSDPGIDLARLRGSVLAFMEEAPTPGGDFGLRFAAMLQDLVVDSVFDTLNGLRETADALELEVLHKENWLWDRRRWPDLDRKMLGLRRLLRQVRWAFMPADEISEFTWGPFVGAADQDRMIGLRLDDLGREAERALETVKDITQQVEYTVALRDGTRTDRLNNTMYVLTAVATVLLVPTVVAGVYGMNFQHIPELGWRLGYLGAWIAIVVLMIGMWFGIRRYLRASESGSVPSESDHD